MALALELETTFGRQETLEHLSKLVNLTPDLVCIIDSESYYKFVNHAYMSMLGWSEYELYRKPFTEFVHPDDRAKSLQVIEEAVNGELVTHFVNRLLCKKGGTRWFSWTGVRSVEDQYVYAVGRDITDEFNLREQLALALESCCLGVWDWQADSDEVYFDDRTRSMFGFAPGYKVAGPECFKSVIHPDDLARVTNAAREVYRSGEYLDIEFRIQSPERGEHWVNSMGKVIRDKKGRPLRMVGVISIIDDRKRREIEHERKLVIEQLAVRKRDEFFSIASHELRSPLTSLKLTFDILKKSMASDGSINLEAAVSKRVIHVALMQLDTLTRAVNTLFDVVQASEGRMTLNCGEWDMVLIVRRVIAQAEELAKASGSTIKLHASESIRGFWDGDRVERVVWNLLTNAIKYGAGKPIDIEIHALTHGVQVTVEDQGPGIPHDQLSRLFQRFERVKGMKKTPGLGLGLYIVKQIVDAHSGKVTCKSVVGKGSTFSVYLPYHS